MYNDSIGFEEEGRDVRPQRRQKPRQTIFTKCKGTSHATRDCRNIRAHIFIGCATEVLRIYIPSFDILQLPYQ